MPSGNILFSELISNYGAVDFWQALTVFITAYNEPLLNQHQLQKAAFRVFLPFRKVLVFHKAKIWNDNPLDCVDGKKVLDVIHSCPVRVVFKIPPKANKNLFGDQPPPDYLAYIEWFSNFPNTPDQHHGLYKISRAHYQGKWLLSIVKVSDIHHSVHLFPQFGSAVPREWASATVLDKCSTFFVNPLSDRHCYLTVY